MPTMLSLNSLMRSFMEPLRTTLPASLVMMYCVCGNCVASHFTVMVSLCDTRRGLTVTRCFSMILDLAVSVVSDFGAGAFTGPAPGFSSEIYAVCRRRTWISTLVKNALQKFGLKNLLCINTINRQNLVYINE